MIRKNWIYILTVILLAASVYFFISDKNKGTYKAGEKEFAVKDTAQIGKIFLADMKNNTVELERNKNTWMVNNTFTARPEAIKTILITIYQLQVNVPVAKSMFDKVIKDIATDNIKVEIYDRRGKKIRSFYIGQPSVNYRGNFMLMEKSKNPFVVSIPGFDGFVSSRFFTNANEWKNRAVFAYRPVDIKEIEVKYFLVPDSSFTIIKKTDEQFEFTSSFKNQSGFNAEIAKYYFNQFTLLNCEDYILNTYKRDSLLAQQPVASITITDKAGVKNNLKIYYSPVDSRTKMQFTYKGEPLQFDMDKFYGIFHDDKDLGIIQNFVFGKILVGPKYFYRSRPTDNNVLIEAAKK